MLPSYFSTRSIIRDPFKLAGLRTDIFDKLNFLKENEKADISPENDFGALLLKALDNVNSLQTQASALSEKLITEPNSVNIHDVTLAGAKATLSLSITKELFDRAIRAYKELINIR